MEGLERSTGARPNKAFLSNLRNFGLYHKAKEKSLK
jgi:hypothetical protein